MSFNGFIWYAGAFALALGILIVVHEFGHFMAARLCGVKVLRFSVGFGKPLITIRRGKDATEWSLATFPLGGYVKMLDEREGTVAPEELHRAFNRQHVSRRALIVIAGPLANLLLAVAIYWGIYMQGVEELRPMLGTPTASTIAERAGIQEKELVRAVSGKPIVTWQDLRWELTRLVADKSDVKLEVINPKGEIDFHALDTGNLPPSAIEGDLLGEIGLTMFRPKLRPIIGQVVKGSPAAVAGITAGDSIISIDGRPITYWSELATTIRDAPQRRLTLEVARADGRHLLAVTPDRIDEGGKSIGRIGIAAQEATSAQADMVVIVQLGPIDALGRAFSQTWETSIFSLRMIGRMVSGELSWKNVSGPVTIADYAGQSARMGMMHYLKFLALISISLGVLNLLPIPILDGGHLMYYLAEIIKGGSLSERVMEIGQQIGLAILLLLMAFAFYNDINRLVSG